MADGFASMADGLSALHEFFINDSTLGETLLRIAELACQAIPPTSVAGMTMLVDGKVTTGVFTDPVACEIDAAQYETGEGPCLDAYRHQQVYRIDSTAEDRRWPTFARDAAAHGVTATLSVPLNAKGEPLGALNLYSRTFPFDDQSARGGEVFARQAGIVLANAKVYQDARQLGENLKQAMRSRSVIDQAVGILMADGGRTSDEAFQLLVRASQRENLKLRDVAAAIVDRVTQRQRRT